MGRHRASYWIVVTWLLTFVCWVGTPQRESQTVDVASFAGFVVEVGKMCLLASNVVVTVRLVGSVAEVTLPQVSYEGRPCHPLGVEGAGIELHRVAEMGDGLVGAALLAGDEPQAVVSRGELGVGGDRGSKLGLGLGELLGGSGRAR